MENTTNNIPTRCPKCTNIVTGRFCSFCGTDLYSPQQNAQQNAGQYYQAHQAPPQNPQYQQYQQYQAYQAYPQYPQYARPVQKKGKNKLLIVIVSVIAAMFLFTTAMLILSLATNTKTIISNENNTMPFADKGTASDYHFTAGVSIDEFNKLEKGMTYAHVSALIGGDGQIVDNGQNLQEENYYTYAWPGENNENAIVYITITNDVVSDISLDGTLDKQ